MKTFNYDRADEREPVPFQIKYRRKVMEKVEVPGVDGGPSGYEERFTGQYSHHEVVFSARPGELTGGQMLAINDMDPADPMAGIKQTRKIREAIDATVVEADEFWALLDDSLNRIPPEAISDTLTWFTEMSSARPTTRPRR